MISQFFILNFKGDSLFYKDYRRDIPQITTNIFWHEMQRTKFKCGPIFNVDGINFVYLFSNQLYFVFATLFNSSPTYFLEMLTSVNRLISDFCGGTSEMTIRNNYTMIFELADEVINFGHPQTTSTDELKPFIESTNDRGPVTIGGIFGKLKSVLPSALKYADDSASSSQSQKAITDESNANNVYLDLLERVNMTVNKERQIVFAESIGFVNIKSYLKTVAGLRLTFREDVVLVDSQKAHRALPNTVLLDDASFHSCVDTAAFDRDQSIRVGALPIGETTLMQYRVTQKIRAPIILSVTKNEVNPHRVELLLRVSSDVPPENIVAKLLIRIPLPKAVSAASSVSNTLDERLKVQEVSDYHPSEKEVTWFIPYLRVSEERLLNVKLTTDESITPFFNRQLNSAIISFEIPNYSSSSLTIMFDAISDGTRNFNPVKWTRKMCYSGSYVIRF